MILTVTLNVAIDKRYVVESFGIDHVNRVKDCTYSAGGKGLNVSRVATIAGAEVLATGFIGGHAGAFVVEELNKQHVNSDFVQVKGETRSCINIYDEAKNTQTEFLEPGVTVTDSMKEEMLVKFTKLVKECNVVTISGSVPRGIESTFYKDLILIAKQYDKKVILDTSGVLLEEGIKAKPTMIKPNSDEIRSLIGRDVKGIEDLIQVASDLQRNGIEVVVISLGSEGSLIACKEGVFQAIVPKIEAVNTVGCGDSMIAGFAVGFERNLPMIDTIKLASAISAANALREETGFFIHEDMQALLGKIKVKKLTS